ncbi:hypothetical protein HDU78_006955 [Chytriomyces hyalinus]|uniref:Uncharacterized protein n=1 Tax=Chytriomyces confervae TaxID=246404 RepID=A0A507FF10_9FUNG|nr:hypothetical protein HDU78_006955 [Chytriomyces hyalinus]KAJ3398561.1 hypothetical protein HDU80_008790 [Chytriomyces hyalinus]TPX74824.1 hypothetical protein CcCBS67573_g03888 [Chytriomyces confervae]
MSLPLDRQIARVAFWTTVTLATYFVGTTVYSLLFAAKDPQPRQLCLHVEGFTNCPYFQRSAQLAKAVSDADTDAFGEASTVGWTRDDWQATRKAALWANIPAAKVRGHTTSPFVWVRECSPGDVKKDASVAFEKVHFIGGNDDFHEWNDERPSAKK